MDNMGSALPIVEVNVSFKFEGNPSIGIGFIERTWHMGDLKKNEDISLFQYKIETESLTMTVYVLKFCF